MTEYKDGDPRYELLGPEERRAGLPTKTRSGTVAPKYDFAEIDTSWRARRRGRALGRALEEQAGGFKIGKQYVESRAEFESARQQLELVQARRQFLPMILEEEQLRLQTEIAKGRGELQAAADLYADHRARRAERRELDAEAHALELARRRRLILEEQLAIERLKGKLGKDDEPARGGQDSDPLGDYIKTETEVRRARSTAARVADAIRNAATAEGRDLTSQEVELLDMYESAAAAAEEHIRKGGAADF